MKVLSNVMLAAMFAGATMMLGCSSKAEIDPADMAKVNASVSRAESAANKAEMAAKSASDAAQRAEAAAQKCEAIFAKRMQK